jgi:hypothetical protein
MQISEDRSIYSGNGFQVAAYRKPEFEISVTSSEPSYVQGDTATVEVQANYFSGGPLSNAPITWRLISRVLGKVALTSREDAAVVYCGHREDISVARLLSNVPIMVGGVAGTRAGNALPLSVMAALAKEMTILVMKRALRRDWTARTRFCPVRHLISGARVRCLDSKEATNISRGGHYWLPEIGLPA